MALIFLCGGMGNQLFQLAASRPGDRFSGVFLAGRLPWLLGWSSHEQVLALPAAPRWCEWGGLALLALDGLLARLTGRALCTCFDLRTIKARALVGRWLQMGYFQDQPPARDLAELGRQFLQGQRLVRARGAAGGGVAAGPWLVPAAAEQAVSAEAHPLRIDIAMHVRGGDVLRLEAQGRNPYGVLPVEYFVCALLRALEGSDGPEDAAGGKGPGERSLTVYTDDRAYAEGLLARIALEEPAISALPVRIDAGPLAGMVAGCLTARSFIACNSTLSWWIVRLRGADGHSVSPIPFARALPLATPEHGDALAVCY